MGVWALSAPSAKHRGCREGERGVVGGGEVAPRVQQGVGYRGWGECRACTAAVRAAAPLAPLPTAAIVFRAAIKCG